MVKQLAWGPILGRPGALCITPGNCENVPASASAVGFKWLAFNVADHRPEEWDVVRSRAAALGMAVYPWGRLRTDTMQDYICLTARAWRTRPLLNIEDEAKPPGFAGSQPWGQPAEVARRIRADFPKIQPILSIPGWPYWGGTDWTPLADFPALLQILWEDMRIPPTYDAIAKVQGDCEFMARKVFRRVGVSYQTYRGTAPTVYERDRLGWSLIWGDTVNDWPAWARVKP